MTFFDGFDCSRLLSWLPPAISKRALSSGGLGRRERSERSERKRPLRDTKQASLLRLITVMLSGAIQLHRVRYILIFGQLVKVEVFIYILSHHIDVLGYF